MDPGGQGRIQGVRGGSRRVRGGSRGSGVDLVELGGSEG